MKLLARIVYIVPLIVLSAAAQDPQLLAQAQLKADELKAAKAKGEIQLKMMGAVTGMAVKGAPYSGEEVNETNHVLADGTRIHRETHAMVYRDSEGRTRRETPDSVMISDPVAGVTYMLDPKTMTGQKLTQSNVGLAYFHAEEGARHEVTNGTPGTYTYSNTSFSVRTSNDGNTPTITVNGQTLDQKTVEELIAKAKASGDHTVTVNGSTIDAGMLTGPRGAVTLMAKKTARVPNGETLGKRMIEGVEAEGTRSVSTIKEGEIGNDRPIQVTGERWYSSELQTVVQSKHSDPRSGEESFRLINIRRGDPGAYLFQPPSGYSISDRK